MRNAKKRSSKPKKAIYKPSIAETLLGILKKTVNCPFEVLLEAGKIQAQLRLGSMRTAVHRLRAHNLILVERRGKKLLFSLTESGKKEANEVAIKLAMLKPKKWDGKWRIIIFDVPEKLRGRRDLLRERLVSFGFFQIQKSVLAYPHTLPQEFLDFWTEIGILKHCIVFETDNIQSGITYFPDRRKV